VDAEIARHARAVERYTLGESEAGVSKGGWSPEKNLSVTCTDMQFLTVITKFSSPDYTCQKFHFLGEWGQTSD